jgi:hypothetical protein
VVHPEGIAVLAVESILGAEPEKALFILQQVENHALRQAVGSGQAFQIGDLGGQVITREQSPDDQ